MPGIQSTRCPRPRRRSPWARPRSGSAPDAGLRPHRHFPQAVLSFVERSFEYTLRRGSLMLLDSRTSGASLSARAAPPPPDYLDELNAEQRCAVEHGFDAASHSEPLLIIAGAGSGKTNTLAHRVAHLVCRGADPRRIML